MTTKKTITRSKLLACHNNTNDISNTQDANKKNIKRHRLLLCGDRPNHVLSLFLIALIVCTNSIEGIRDHNNIQSSSRFRLFSSFSFVSSPPTEGKLSSTRKSSSSSTINGIRWILTHERNRQIIKSSSSHGVFPPTLLRKPLTELNLFSLNMKEGGNDNDKNTDNQKEDEGLTPDLSAWVQNLNRWPSPSTTVPSLEEESMTKKSAATVSSLVSNKNSSSTTAINNSNNNTAFLSPLTNLLNLKDILLAQGKSLPTVINDSALIEISAWDNWLSMLKKKTEASKDSNTPTNLADGTIADLMTKTTAATRKVSEELVEEETSSSSSSSEFNIIADSLFKNATSKLEYLLSEAADIMSPKNFQSIIFQSKQFLLSSKEDSLIETAAKELAISSGLDDFQAAQSANETISYVNNLVMVADTVLRYGFVEKRAEIDDPNDELSFQRQESFAKTNNKALFSNISQSAKVIPPKEYPTVIEKGAQMAHLAAAIYEETYMENCIDIGHSIVAKGTTANAAWMVTDSIADDTDFYHGGTKMNMDKKSKSKDSTKNKSKLKVEGSANQQQPPTSKPIHVRTITVRGYDASDDKVDREELLNAICTIMPQPWENKNSENTNANSNSKNSNPTGVLVHSGIFSVAKDIYEDIKKYIDWSAPTTKIVFNGHSIGGAISILCMLLLSKEKGVGFVRDKVLRVFTFGSPPIFTFAKGQQVNSWTNKDIYSCDILNALGLPSSMVYSYGQPWDPILRVFSEYDGLYPLIDDLGVDGITLYANGPPRTLRFIVRALVEAWGDGWNRTRDVLVEAGAQNYQQVGIQHLFLPEPLRYLSDRFVSTNVNVPEIEQLVRVSSRELYPILESCFPLSVFELSMVPAAIRGFLHHFFPAYDQTMIDYAANTKKIQLAKAQQEQQKLLKNGKPVNKKNIDNFDDDDANYGEMSSGNTKKGTRLVADGTSSFSTTKISKGSSLAATVAGSGNSNRTEENYGWSASLWFFS